MDRYGKSAAGVLLSFVGMLACILVWAGAWALRTYGPAIREWLLWLATPQFALGMVFQLAICIAGAWMVVSETRPEARRRG